MASSYDILEEEQENPFLRPAPLPFPAVKPVAARPPVPEMALPSEPPEPGGLPPIPPGFTLDRPAPPKEKEALPQEPGIPPIPPGFTLDKEPAKEEEVAKAPPATELGYLDKLKRRWEMGREQAADDQLAYKAAKGELKWEDVKDQLEPGQDHKTAEGKAWYSEGLLAAAEMLPAMIGGLVEGGKWGAGAAAGALALGQLGPQVGLPEELITVPTAFGYGTKAGAFEYWRKQGTGSLYNDLRKEGIGHGVAQAVSVGFGIPYAGIEFMQMTKLVPGVKQSVAHAITGAIKDKLIKLGKEKLIDYGEQIGQETAQELLQASAEGIAEWKDGVTPPPEKKGIWERAGNTIVQTAASMPFLMAPSAATDVGRMALDERRAAAAPAAVAAVPPPPGAAIPPPPGAAVPPAVTPSVVPPVPTQAQALQQAAVQAGQLPAQQAGLLRQAAVQAPTLIADEGQRKAALLGQAAAAATPEAQAAQGVQQADLLRQAAVQAPGLAAEPKVVLPPGMTPAEATAAPPAPDPVAERLAVVNRQLLRTTNSRTATGLEKERRVLENKLESAQNVAVVKESATKAAAAGAPRTAQALVQSTTEVLTARDRVVRDAVDQAPEDIFAPEVSSAGPRRGEPGFVSPPGGGEVIGARPAAVPAAVTPAVTPPGVAAPPTPGVTPGAAAPPAAAPGLRPPVVNVVPPEAAVPTAPVTIAGIKAPIALTRPMQGALRNAIKGTSPEYVQGNLDAFNRELVRSNPEHGPVTLDQAKVLGQQLATAEGAAEAASLVTPSPETGEAVFRPGIRGQEAVIQRPSAQMAQGLAGAKVNVEVFSRNGEKRMQSQDAATALLELKRDKAGFRLLSDCLNLK